MKQKKKRNKKRRSRIAITFISVMSLLVMFGSVYASATGVGEVDAMFTNFDNFITGIVVWVGRALLLFGAVKFGMSFQSHDPSQRSQGLLFILSGVIVALAPQIISYIAG